jgi:hypothetical protein
MEGYPGQEFTFTGLDFTPNGLIHEGFSDPNQEYRYRASFFADASGGFVRTITTGSDWLTGVYTYMAYDVSQGYNVSAQFIISENAPTLTTTPEPMVTVSPSEASAGAWFTFTGSHFTAQGLIEDWLVNPNQVQRSLGYFRADSSGGFIRKHRWEEGSPAGTYTYLAIDLTSSLCASVEFEMLDSLTYEVYLPIIVKNY